MIDRERIIAEYARGLSMMRIARTHDLRMSDVREVLEAPRIPRAEWGRKINAEMARRGRGLAAERKGKPRPASEVQAACIGRRPAPVTLPPLSFLGGKE